MGFWTGIMTLFDLMRLLQYELVGNILSPDIKQEPKGGVTRIITIHITILKKYLCSNEFGWCSQKRTLSAFMHQHVWNEKDCDISITNCSVAKIAILNVTCKNKSVQTFLDKIGASNPAIYGVYAIQGATEKMSHNPLPLVKKLLPTLIILPEKNVLSGDNYWKYCTSYVTYHSFKRVVIIS